MRLNESEKSELRLAVWLGSCSIGFVLLFSSQLDGLLLLDRHSSSRDTCDDMM